MAKFECMQCNYIYDEAEHGSVMELTDDYTCPECGTNKTWLSQLPPEPEEPTVGDIVDGEETV
jgi:rubredoxin